MFSLYIGPCFDGVVVSFNFEIDSVLGLPLSFPSPSFNSLSLPKCVFRVLYFLCIFITQLSL